MDEKTVVQVGALDGVTEAEPQVFYPYTLDSPSGPKSITLLGVQPGKLGAPRPDAGRGLENPGEALAQPMYGLRLGSTARVGGKSFRIVGTFHESTMLGGIPNVFVSTTDLQSIAFKGAPVITAVAVKGSPTHPADGLKMVNRADASCGPHPAARVRETDHHASLAALVGRHRLHHRVGHLSVSARADARLRRLQSDRRLEFMGAVRARAPSSPAVDAVGGCGDSHRAAPRAGDVGARRFSCGHSRSRPGDGRTRVRSREPRWRSPCCAGRSSTGVRMRDVRCPT